MSTRSDPSKQNFVRISGSQSSHYLLISAFFLVYLVFFYADQKNNKRNKSLYAKSYQNFQMVGKQTTIVITLCKCQLGAVHTE